MRILLSYSLAHFDPRKTPAEHPYWQSSASILARTFYDALGELGEVTYIDRTDYASIIGKEFDLFVGIAENFNAIIKSCRIKRSVFFAVNMHPRERNSILRRALREFRIPRSAVAGSELHDSRAIERSLNAADHILCVGNDRTVQSYVKYGIPRSKIRRINYGILHEQPARHAPCEKRVRNFVYVASEIGLRKGFDLLADIAATAMEKRLPFCLKIIGKPSTPYYENKLATLVANSKGSIINYGWIDSASEAYWTLLGSADFAIFPSLEEGQAGSVLDCISAGAIPIITENSGLDFSPLGYLTCHKSQDNVSIFEMACALDASAMEALRENTLGYYRDFHQSFKLSLSSALGDILSGNTLPKLSVVLPIFNKQNSIIELLVWLNASCRAYGNIELHVFFDGCTDQTESVVRRFFRNRTTYPVTFETTPNIFEVKTNNLGLKKASGEIVVVVQDDNYIYDTSCFYQAVDLFGINPKMAVLGGLAGVNYYPRGTTDLKGRGQIACNANEVYWRQDASTDPALSRRVFQVDACMRGPLFIRRSHAKTLNYLDEIYAPLYQDDMDFCFRAWTAGYQVFCSLMPVENRSLTMANYDPERNKFFNTVMKRNTDIFYSRHTPNLNKPTLWIHNNYKPERLAIQLRIAIAKLRFERKALRLAEKATNRLRKIKRALLND